MLGEFDFNPAPEVTDSDIKLFIGEPGNSNNVDIETFSSGFPLSGRIDKARLVLKNCKFQEFGALKDNIKIERKAGQTKTNYKDSKLNEANFSMINCTENNYTNAGNVDGTRVDLIELDEGNGILKIFPNMKIEITEIDENKKHPEISFKLTNDSFSSTARIVIDLKKSLTAY